MNQNSGAIFLAGPTACGKSALALRLAEALGGAIVNADSMQVYRELRVLTARPSEADEARAPHFLYGALSVTEACSVGRWLDLTEQALAEISERGLRPILVGGTGLYFKAISEGLAEVPAISPEVREQAREMQRTLGPEGLHAELAARDRVMAGRLAPGDTQRVARAWEVIEDTGTSLAEWQSRPPAPPLLAAAGTSRFVLDPPREEIYARCEARLDAMIDGGALDEAAALEAMGLDPALPAARALGVPELRRHVRGEIALEEALAAAKTATRRYAKRQMTWFRNQTAGWIHISKQDSESIVNEIFAYIC